MTDLADLLYMRARYYMSSIGRFFNKDPIGLAGGMNLYGYVRNEPIGHNDPSGEFIDPATAAWIFLGGMAIWFFEWIAQQLRDTGMEPIGAPGPAEEPIQIPKPQYQERCPPPGR